MASTSHGSWASISRLPSSRGHGAMLVPRFPQGVVAVLSRSSLTVLSRLNGAPRGRGRRCDDRRTGGEGEFIDRDANGMAHSLFSAALLCASSLAGSPAPAIPPRGDSAGVWQRSGASWSRGDSSVSGKRYQGDDGEPSLSSSAGISLFEDGWSHCCSRPAGEHEDSSSTNLGRER